MDIDCISDGCAGFADGFVDGVKKMAGIVGLVFTAATAVVALKDDSK